MSVIKVKLLEGFTILSNNVLENPKLSFKAKGLWAYCMSRKETWEFHVSHLSTVSKEGVDAVYSALDELIQEGLVVRHQERKGRGEGQGRGTAGKVEYTVYATPQPLDVSKNSNNFSETDFPVPKESVPKNPALTSTDLKTSTDKEIVCPKAAIASSASKILKKTSDGKEIEASQDEIYRKAIGRCKDWTPEEMAKAWQALIDATVCNDPWRFIEGTIENIRTKTRFAKMKKATEKQDKQETTECPTPNTQKSPPALDMLKLLSQTSGSVTNMRQKSSNG